MSNLLDKICALRDLIADKKYSKFKYLKMELLQLKEEIHRQISKKNADNKHELEFTAQDLRELATDIRTMMNDWSEIMNPDKNIKSIDTNIKDGVVDINPFLDKVVPIMQVRTLIMQPLIELLNLIEYHAAFLYYLELSIEDEFALKYTERVI